MVAGEVCRGFFQELKLHLQLPGLPLELAAVRVHPVAEGAFVNTEIFRHPGKRARRLDYHLHGFILELGREALLRSGQNLHLSRLTILMDGLSGRFGALQQQPRTTSKPPNSPGTNSAASPPMTPTATTGSCAPPPWA